MPSAVLVTGHTWGSKRRAGFHWIADALRSQGWQVTFLTVGFSWLSYLKDDHRHADGAHRSANRRVELEPGIDIYVWYTPFHPLNRLPRLVDMLATPLFRMYGALPAPGLRAIVEEADLIIYESTSGLALGGRFRAWNPRARVVYRVSDDLGLLRAPRVTVEAERELLTYADLISVPSAAVAARFAGHSQVEVQHHGLDTTLFDQASADPYARPGTHAVFVGTAHLDRQFLGVAAQAFPDWRFHVIGPLDHLPSAPNVVAHGEVPFAATVPFITHADVALAPFEARPGAESFSDSLKVIQYSYAGLPIVAPDFLRSTRPNVFAYRPGDPSSIETALRAARSFTDSKAARCGVGSWADLARALAGPLAPATTADRK